MSVQSSAGLLPKAIIAAVVGSVAGGTAGVWSLPRPVPAPSATSPSTSLPTQVAPSADDEADVLQRARTLARRPDVTALMDLRDDVVLRARERGIAGSASVKGELDELDRRLTEARTLQLKLDAEEFRKAGSKPTR